MAIAEYKVTTELHTSRWTKFLRFLHLKPARPEFIIVFPSSSFEAGDILNVGAGELDTGLPYDKVLILEILK